MTDKTDTTALREAAIKATKGRWIAFSDDGSKTYAVHTPNDKRCENIVKWPGFDCQKNAKANAEFIALANPATIIALLNQLEAERQRADKAESYARERDSENESIALTVGRLRLELAKLRGRLDTPIVIPPRKTAKDYVDDEFSNADLAAIYNAARLELKAKIKNAGFTAKDGE